MKKWRALTPDNYADDWTAVRITPSHPLHADNLRPSVDALCAAIDAEALRVMLYEVELQAGFCVPPRHYDPAFAPRQPEEAEG